MKYFLLFFLLFSTAAFAAPLEKDFPGWEIYQQVSGDLNGDGVADTAAIIWQKRTDENDGAVNLVIYFGNKIHTKSENAICIGCGGPKAVFDEPLGTLEIKKGILTISYFGGSREAYDILLKWRYDKDAGKFFLIGETRTVTDTLGEEPAEFIDINFVSGKIDRRVGKKATHCTAPENVRKQNLAEFEYEEKNGDMVDALAAACH